MVEAYVIVALVGLAVAATTVWLRAVLLVLALAAVLSSPLVGIEPVYKVAHLFAVFAAAAVLEVLRHRIPVRPPLLLAAAAILVVSYHVPFVVLLVLQAAVVPYLVAYLGQHGLADCASSPAPATSRTGCTSTPFRCSRP